MNNRLDTNSEHLQPITRIQREARLRQEGSVLWFTGLSGAGKTTISVSLERKLFKMGKWVYTLDGDKIRQGLNRDLGFSLEDRQENIRRIGEVAKLFADSGYLVIVAFISPIRRDRDQVRKSVSPINFVEVFVDCPLTICEERDPKGLYKKARNNEVKEFTGITSPYEPPANPEIHLHTERQSPEDCLNTLIDYLDRLSIFKA